MKIGKIRFLYVTRAIIIFIIVTMVSILICAGILFYRNQQRESGDKIIIDVFGRQRMLTQSISKDASRYYILKIAASEGYEYPPAEINIKKEDEIKKSLEQAKAEFSIILDSMHEGYLVSGSDVIDIRGSVSAAKPYIDEIDGIWQNYLQAIDTLLIETGLNDKTADALIYINENNQRLLELCEKVSDTVVNDSLRNSRNTEYLILTLISVLIAIMIVSFINLFRYILIPYRRLYQGIADIGLLNVGNRIVPDRSNVQPIVSEIHDMFLKINDMFALIENMNNNISFEDMLNFIRQTFSSFIPYNYIGIALFDQEKEHLRAAFGVSDGTVMGLPEKLLGKVVHINETSLGNIMKSGRARIISDLEDYTSKKPLTEYNKIILDAGIRSSITLPLRLADEPVGMIFFSSTKKNEYTEEHVKFLKVLVNSLAVSFHQNIFISDLLYSSILALAKLAEARDQDTGEHLERMKEYSRAIAEFLLEEGVYREELTNDYVERIRRFSPLHDIGKVGIRDGILLKPGSLTPEEFEEMKKHTIYGADVLRAAETNLHSHGQEMFKLGIEIAEGHQEKWDGTGYPYGRKGFEIPLSARIVAVADVFDALTSKRPYKDAIPFDRAFDMMLNGSGSHFDPNIIAVFAKRREKIFELYSKFHNV